MTIKEGIGLVVAAIGAFASAPAVADNDEVTVTLAPYLWAPTIGGTVSLAGASLPIRATPQQLASGVRAGVLGYAAVERRGSFIATEVLAVDFRRARFAPVFGQNLAARVISIEAVAGHRFAMGRGVALSPFAGVRYNNLTVDVGTSPANIAVSGEWAEPLIGLVALVQRGNRWSLTAKVDRSVGSGARHSFDARASVDYRFARRFSAFAGYRHTAQYYDNRDRAPFTIDLRGNGPLLGVRGDF